MKFILAEWFSVCVCVCVLIIFFGVLFLFILNLYSTPERIFATNLKLQKINTLRM